ncbi:hypothetical protein [Nakamurella sp. PAMC28650]|uniref:hypothetical protein n=1 Tax=Nakamurella sp. PAMC28650 TaxID=2762325 RepID=UPI00164CECA9|nr:hypothetical protein [Nakamurella sp. PAMC28650]QNK82852.1 hypothetical protein H7F38_09370 [Nakamurella sp. PAMC28650]
MTSAAPTIPRRPQQSKTAMARQVKEQRRGYARAVLAALARSLSGRPAAQVRRVLQDSLRPLGVRLSPTELQAIAKNISTGQPVQLP